MLTPAPTGNHISGRQVSRFDLTQQVRRMETSWIPCIGWTPMASVCHGFSRLPSDADAGFRISDWRFDSDIAVPSASPTSRLCHICPDHHLFYRISFDICWEGLQHQLQATHPLLANSSPPLQATQATEFVWPGSEISDPEGTREVLLYLCCDLDHNFISWINEQKAHVLRFLWLCQSSEFRRSSPWVPGSLVL